MFPPRLFWWLLHPCCFYPSLSLFFPLSVTSLLSLEVDSSVFCFLCFWVVFLPFCIRSSSFSLLQFVAAPFHGERFWGCEGWDGNISTLYNDSNNCVFTMLAVHGKFIYDNKSISILYIIRNCNIVLGKERLNLQSDMLMFHSLVWFGPSWCRWGHCSLFLAAIGWGFSTVASHLMSVSLQCAPLTWALVILPDTT
jgi:hypothetical protein